jgi:hypothetical protein
MNISKNNIFTFGYSRGSLALWQALQPDMGLGTTGRPSSLPTAFFGYQAQTTYQCQQFADLFVLNDQYKAPQVQECKDTNWAYLQFGSAVASVTKFSVPVHLQYQQGFELMPGTTTLIKLLSWPDLDARYEVEHYPDYGIALLNAYTAKQNTRMDYPEKLISYQSQFIGWQNFVGPKVVPDQP